MPVAHHPSQNHLLAALPPAEFERLSVSLELVPMSLGDALYESGRQLEHAYFPITAIVALLYVTQSGASSEIAGVGPEGIVGMPLFMGGNSTPSSAVVRTAGHAYRLQSSRARRRIPARRRGTASVVAPHAGTDHADVSDRRLQSSPFG